MGVQLGVLLGDSFFFFVFQIKYHCVDDGYAAKKKGIQSKERSKDFF